MSVSVIPKLSALSNMKNLLIASGLDPIFKEELEISNPNILNDGTHNTIISVFIKKDSKYINQEKTNWTVTYNRINPIVSTSFIEMRSNENIESLKNKLAEYIQIDEVYLNIKPNIQEDSAIQDIIEFGKVYINAKINSLLYVSNSSLSIKINYDINELFQQNVNAIDDADKNIYFFTPIDNQTLYDNESLGVIFKPNNETTFASRINIDTKQQEQVNDFIYNILNNMLKLNIDSEQKESFFNKGNVSIDNINMETSEFYRYNPKDCVLFYPLQVCSFNVSPLLFDGDYKNNINDLVKKIKITGMSKIIYGKFDIRELFHQSTLVHDDEIEANKIWCPEGHKYKYNTETCVYEINCEPNELLTITTDFLKELGIDISKLIIDKPTNETHDLQLSIPVENYAYYGRVLIKAN